MKKYVFLHISEIQVGVKDGFKDGCQFEICRKNRFLTKDHTKQDLLQILALVLLLNFLNY